MSVPVHQFDFAECGNTPAIDADDRRIIQASQSGLPLTEHPYHSLAQQLDMRVEDVLARMQRMQQSGIIRRIGLVPHHYRLGFRANGMSVWDIDETLIDELGHMVGALKFVSHCYRRPRLAPEWPYNLFAMVHGTSTAEVHDKVRIIADLLGPDNRGHDVLFSTKVLKKTGLRIPQGAPCSE